MSCQAMDFDSPSRHMTTLPSRPSGNYLISSRLTIRSGDVFWATADNTSLLYVNENNRVIIKVDNESDVVYLQKRYAPKLLSQKTWDIGTVWVMDAVHMPYGCSVWPAFWTRKFLPI